MEKNFRIFFDLIQAGILVLDTSGKIIFVNAYALDKSKWSKEELIGSVLPLKPSADYKRFYELVFQGQSVELPPNVTLTMRGGGELSIIGSFSPLYDQLDKVKEAVLTFFDATTIRRTEAEQKTFFSTAAHELRTPLTIVKTGLAYFFEYKASLSEEKQQELLHDVYEAAEQLADLVDDFLQVARIEQSRIEVKKEAVEIVSIVKTVIDEYRPLLKEKKLYLTHESMPALPKVTGDAIRIKEVLLNLVSNSIKYTIQGGITIIQKSEDNKIVTQVSDTGMGIPPEQHRLLFKKFQQIGYSRTQSTAKSTGLGLYVAKQLVKLMGGDLELESSEPGKGTTFSFWLPIAPV